MWRRPPCGADAGQRFPEPPWAVKPCARVWEDAMPFRWILDEGQQPEYCLDSLPFDAWIDFVFKHPLPKEGGERWYSLDAFESYHFKDALLFLERLERLFRGPEILLNRFSTEQIKQGLWSFITAFELPDLLEDASLSLPPRLGCIQSVPEAYT